MAAIAATNSATTSLQSALIKNRIEQARRQADQAEAHAQDLRSQADQQEQVVVQSRQKVRTLESGASAMATVGKPISISNNNANALPQGNPTYIGNIGKFAATKGSVSASQASSTQAIQRYSQQVVAAPSQIMGRVISATA
ncbi:MAG: hypothetical protein ACOYNF_14265 [Rhodoferax sp.]